MDSSERDELAPRSAADGYARHPGCLMGLEISNHSGLSGNDITAIGSREVDLGSVEVKVGNKCVSDIDPEPPPPSS